MQVLAPRTFQSVGLVTLAASLFLVGAGFLSLCVLDGYWLTGAHGYLVVPGLLASCIGVPMALRAFWGHVVRGSPVIGYHEGRFHYVRAGQLCVAASAVKEVDVCKKGRFIRFLGADGEELQKYPLVLSSVAGSAVAERANRIIRDETCQLASL
jgi:hypothetical protein